MSGRTLFSRVHFGGDYNPEQWDPSVWREDVFGSCAPPASIWSRSAYSRGP